MNDNLAIIKQTRQIAADSLYTVLKKVIKSNKKISEVAFRDMWLTEMQKNKNIFPEGWYVPPPHGIIVLFGTDKDVTRINYLSVRPEGKWPRDDIFLNLKNGIAYVYASPVDKESGIIGDFGMTIYFGKQKEIKEILVHCFEADKQIFEQSQIGMTLGDIAEISRKTLKNFGMQNDSLAITDKGVNVLGHTIPDGFSTWSTKEKNTLSKNNWSLTKDIISKKRINVKDNEKFVITLNSAHTIEPRPKTIGKPELPESLSYHTISLYKKDGSKELLTSFDKLFKLVGMDYMVTNKSKKMTYEESGVSYASLDPAKTLAQEAGEKTAVHLKNYGFAEVSDSRGESAFVWKQKNTYMASVTESLGTKNLVADSMRKITGKTYYNLIGYDTVSTAVNDLASVGAKPLVVTAFWAVGDGKWFDDIERTKDLVDGWKEACDDSGATWGGGESPAYNNIVNPETIALGSNVVGIIPTKKRIMQDSKIESGDRILLLKSSGINANGLSLARAVAKKLPKGYATKLPDGSLYGEAILRRSNIYAKLVQALLDAKINLHYISNITGHGLRKVMRGRGDFTYTIEKIFEPHILFTFIQKHTGMSDAEIYGTYNMGQDYAIFLPKKDIKKAQQIIKKHSFESLDAGYVTKGEKKVVIQPLNITFEGDRLKVRL